jgi:hypothetical protein
MKTWKLQRLLPPRGAMSALVRSALTIVVVLMIVVEVNVVEAAAKNEVVSRAAKVNVPARNGVKRIVAVSEERGAVVAADGAADVGVAEMNSVAMRVVPRRPLAAPTTSRRAIVRLRNRSRRATN